MNQRPGRYHSAALHDSGSAIPLSQLIRFVRAAQAALEKHGEDDSALRFEILGDYLQEDVVNGKPFEFTTKTLGL